VAHPVPPSWGRIREMPTTNGSPSAEWPAVPPAPAPTKPVVVSAPPAPLLGTTLGTATEPRVDEEPTMAIDTATAPVLPTRPVRTARTRLRVDPVSALQEAARRRVARSAERRPEIVWQPRFAYGVAVVIVLALAVITLPLWIVLFRITGAPDTRPADVIALCMMLTGGFLTAAALWSILVETRGRFRMVDTLARTGEQQALFVSSEPEPPPLERPGDLLPFTSFDRGPATDPHGFTMPAATAIPSVRMPAHAVPVTAHPIPHYQTPSHVPAHIAARAEADQANAAAMLDASSRLLGSFSGVLKSFGQLPAQVATLAVALALFVGATVLSLH
jgi:hypothetical protein